MYAAVERSTLNKAHCLMYSLRSQKKLPALSHERRSYCEWALAAFVSDGLFKTENEERRNDVMEFRGLNADCVNLEGITVQFLTSVV